MARLTLNFDGRVMQEYGLGLMVTIGSTRRAVLRVVAGRTDRTEYQLGGHASLIGRSETALVRCTVG